MSSFSRRTILEGAGLSLVGGAAGLLGGIRHAAAQTTGNNAICVAGPSTNPDVVAIAKRVSHVVGLSLTRAANVLHNIPGTTLPATGIEKKAFDVLKEYPSINKAMMLRPGGLSRSGISIKNKIDINNIHTDFSSNESILEQAKHEGYFGGSAIRLSPAILNIIPSSNAEQIVQTMAFRQVLPDRGTPAAPPPKRKARELHLKLRALRAVRRFGLEVTDWGDDSMVSGGEGLDSTQQQVHAPETFIHTFKRDNENFVFPNHDPTFVKFDLNRPGPWPRFFTGTAFIAEKDASGGFIDFLQKLWDAIGAQVVQLATSLTLAAAGAVTGAAITSASVVGTIIGAVVGAAIGFIAGLIIDSLKDDIFTSAENPVGTVLDSQDSLFPGNNVNSPYYTQDFTLQQSRYIMTYYWHLEF